MCLNRYFICVTNCFSTSLRLRRRSFTVVFIVIFKLFLAILFIID